MVLVHGFTQAASSWEPFATRLSALHEVVAVDAPGHGRSEKVRAGLWEAAEMIGDACGPGCYVGYSMGGRMALHLALRRPELVRRLVLVSATAGIEDPAERSARVEADEAVAERAERDGLEAFVRWWLRRPLFATLPEQAAALGSRRSGSASGLASSLRLAGTGRQEPLWGRLGSLSMPVLVVAGALDEAYAARARRIAVEIGPNASVVVIPGAGHACHLERPDAWLDALCAWLDA